MGNFWSNLGEGLKIAGQSAWAVIQGGVDTAIKAGEGFASGGPLGAIAAGVTSGISNISTAVDRISSIVHEGDSSSQPSGKPTDPASAPTIVSHPAVQATNTLSTANTVKGLVDNVGPSSPDTLKQAAISSAQFHDALAKNGGDIVAAVKAAGGTPITSALSAGMSAAVANHVMSTTGFNAPLRRRLDPISAAMSMTPSTSAYAPAINKHLSGGGAEAMALGFLNKKLAAPATNPFMIGGGA